MTTDSSQFEKQALLSVEQLHIAIRNDQGESRDMVSGVSFAIAAGETLGLVGESGCGKSLTAMSILGLLPQPHAGISAGSVRYKGEDLAKLAKQRLRELRSADIAVIFQDPMTALNPVQSIGRQIEEVLRLHFPALNAAERRRRVLSLLDDVGIPAAADRVDAYPHQLSGGMRQRVMIAIALAGEPELLIADEPTTALDVTIQAQIISLLISLQQKRGMGMLFITHDLALVAQLADHIAVMYAGKIVEQQTAKALFRAPRHPYTKGLLAALPGAAKAPKTRLAAMSGQVPSVDEMPEGCRFANRCSHADSLCLQRDPPLEHVGEQVAVACHHWRSLND